MTFLHSWDLTYAIFAYILIVEYKQRNFMTEIFLNFALIITMLLVFLLSILGALVGEIKLSIALMLYGFFQIYVVYLINNKRQ